jgi:hypothetical protein
VHLLNYNVIKITSIFNCSSPITYGNLAVVQLTARFRAIDNLVL